VTPKIETPDKIFSGSKSGSPATVIAPSVYLFAATAVCEAELGVIVIPDTVVKATLLVLVPALTYPAVCVALAVITPDEFMLIDGVACVAVATDLVNPLE